MGIDAAQVCAESQVEFIMFKVSKTTSTSKQVEQGAQSTVESTSMPSALAALVTQIAEIAVDEYFAGSKEDGEDDDCSGIRPV